MWRFVTMPYKDPEQRKQHRKDYYQKTKKQAHEYYSQNKQKYRERNLKTRSRNTEFVNQYKLEKGCNKCGYKEYACALDFHHLHSKNENVARLSKSCHSLESLTEEMNKCIVLCANCHIVQHYILD